MVPRLNNGGYVMTVISITSRGSNTVLFRHDVANNTIRRTLEAAVKSGASLRCADLHGADLRNARLRGAELDGADLDGAELDGEILTRSPISIQNLRWNILITSRWMRIGCQRHQHEQWADFSDMEVAPWHEEALQFWRTWKAPLLTVCAQHAAANGQEEPA